ncbi:MAG: hypothetical protein MRZ79_03330 [Bacteroidia bacterium]|nr:hypothetical protein [Bacteroidia bacterium]
MRYLILCLILAGLFSSRLKAQSFVFTELRKFKALDAMYEDKRGNLWFYQREKVHYSLQERPSGLVKVDGDEITPYKNLQGVDLSNFSFQAPLEDKDGNFFLFAPGSNLVLFSDGTGMWLLSSGHSGIFLNLVQDKDGNISSRSSDFFSGFPKVFKIDSKRLDLTTETQLASLGFFKNVGTSKNGDLYLLGYTPLPRSKGLYKYNSEEGLQALLKNKYTGDVLIDSDGGIWVGGVEGKLTYINDTGIRTFKMKGNYYNWDAGTGIYWLGIIPGVILSLAVPDYTAPTYLAESSDRIWLVSRDHGLGYVKDDKLHKIANNSNGIKKPNKSNGIFVDSQDNVWVSKSKKGLSMFDGRKWKNYTKLDGLPKKCLAVSEDSQGNIWVMGKNGISKMPATHPVLSKGKSR